jgi:Flagellar biosynthesis protein, FliO
MTKRLRQLKEEEQDAFTLGGGLAKAIEPALVGCDPKPQTRSDLPRRRTATSRRTPKRLKYASKNALVQKIVVSKPTPAAVTVSAEYSPMKKSGWLAGLKARRDFPALLKRAMHIDSAGIAPLPSIEGKSGAPPAQPPVPRELPEQRGRTLSIRIVLPTRSALRLKTLLHGFASAWSWMRQQVKTRRTRKRLVVCETVSLGEKRFVAVVEVDGEQFLLGGASSSVTAIARLGPPQRVSGVLDPLWEQDPAQA